MIYPEFYHLQCSYSRKDPLQFSLWSRTAIFDTRLITPTAPSLTSPRNRTLLTGTTPTFTWTETTYPGNETEFVLYQEPTGTIVETKRFPAKPRGQSTTYTYGGNLLTGTTYSWTLKSINTQEELSSPTSAKSTFYIPVAATNLSTPSNNADLNNVQPEFRWNAVNGAARYSIQVSSTPTFTGRLIVNQAVTGTTYTPIIELTRNTRLYWRVTAIGGVYGNSVSSVYSFTTPNAPYSPTLSSPAVNAKLSTNPTFTWVASRNRTPEGRRYHLQISENPGFETITLEDLNIPITQTTFQSATSLAHFKT